MKRTKKNSWFQCSPIQKFLQFWRISLKNENDSGRNSYVPQLTRTLNSYTCFAFLREYSQFYRKNGVRRHKVIVRRGFGLKTFIFISKRNLIIVSKLFIFRLEIHSNTFVYIEGLGWLLASSVFTHSHIKTQAHPYGLSQCEWRIGDSPANLNITSTNHIYLFIFACDCVVWCYNVAILPCFDSRQSNFVCFLMSLWRVNKWILIRWLKRNAASVLLSSQWN